MQIAFEDREAPKQEKPYDLRGVRILIIEDYPFIAQLMASSLREMGVGEVVTAFSINAARNRLIEHNKQVSSKNVDAVILDWMMPDGTGLELLQWVREHASETMRYLPVIICSAHASAEMVSLSRDNGANEVMVKPVSARKLAQRLLHIIDKPRPFLKTGDFFGPDRRRKEERFEGKDKRETEPDEMIVHHERHE